MYENFDEQENKTPGIGENAENKLDDALHGAHEDDGPKQSDVDFKPETQQVYTGYYPQYAQQYPKPPVREKKKSKGVGIGAIIAIALGCALVGGLLGAGLTAFIGGARGGMGTASGGTNSPANIYEGNREGTDLNTVQVNTGEEKTAAEIYAANVNSTVGITTSVTTNYFGYQTTSAASGSGFIITEDGYVITNYHVIEGANTITVTAYDGTSYQAELIGYDESNDIAVLKIDAEGLTPVILGDSGKMNVGDEVIAIGNPLGELTFSLTAGTVSALDREVTINNVAMNLIQTDCAINSGNSGGALFNMYGEVIGITNAKYSSSSSGASIDNIGFAIPMNSVRGIFESIIENGYISKPYIGVYLDDVSDEMSQFGLPEGAVISSVMEDSPAEEAGLEKNDIVTEVNGTEIKSVRDMMAAVSDAKAGDVLVLKVYRQGETLEISITVAEKQQSAFSDNSNQGGSQQQPNGGYYPFPWGLFPFN